MLIYGYVNGIYQTPFNNMDDLKTRITNAIATVDDATSGMDRVGIPIITCRTGHKRCTCRNVLNNKKNLSVGVSHEPQFLTVCRYIFLLLDYKVIVNLYVNTVKYYII